MLGIAGLTGGPFSDSREVYLLNEGRRGDKRCVCWKERKESARVCSGWGQELKQLCGIVVQQRSSQSAVVLFWCVFRNCGLLLAKEYHTELARLEEGSHAC